MDYWDECIRIAFEDAGIVATEEQISEVVGTVEGGFGNYNMAFGYDVASKNFESDAEIELKKLKLENERRENWINSTLPCIHCTTTGTTYDVWGRPQTCDWCDGKGRVSR